MDELTRLQAERDELPRQMTEAAQTGDAQRLSALRARRDTIAVEIEIAAVAVVRASIEVERQNHSRLRAQLVSEEAELARRAQVAGEAEMEARRLAGQHNAQHLLVMRLENSLEIARVHVGELRSELRRRIQQASTGEAVAPPQIGAQTAREIFER